jgi:UDP-glucose:(heptosyl)LPS alpha-1,3-glucosyltransferase
VRLALLIYKYFPYGGLQRDFARFVTELQARGHHCRVYCAAWQGPAVPAIDLRLAPASRGSHVRRNERFLAWTQADMAQQPVDGVVGFNKMPGLDVYYAGDSCYLDWARRERGVLYRLGWRFRHFAASERAVFGAASRTHVLLISAREQRRFESCYHTPAARMHLLPPGVEPDRRRPPDAAARRTTARHRLGLLHDEHTLLFVGSDFVRKGLDRAIRALAALRAAFPGRRFRLLVAGQGRVGRLALLAKRQQVGELVTFLGGRDDIPELMLAADVLVHPARSEAAGIVLLEAIVAGLPVVVSGECGYADHVAKAGAGTVLLEPFAQADLDAAVQGSVDSHYRRRCSAGGLAYAASEDLYSLHRSGADLIEHIVRRKGVGDGV